MTSRQRFEIPFNDLRRIDLISTNAIDEIASVVKSGWWLNGKHNERFASEFSAYVGTSHCVNVANGSDALELSMRALLDVRKSTGTEVITVANAGGYASISAHIVGLTPVYVDIDPMSHLMSIDSVLQALSDDTAFVVATHLFGGVIDIHALREDMNRAGYTHVPILEDCAQAHGAELRGHKVGSLGDIATFSFYPTKNLGAIGDAGAIVTNDVDLAQASRSLSQYGWNTKYSIDRAGGRNSRMDEVQAAFLANALRRLDNFNERRLSILSSYEQSCSRKIRLIRSELGTVGHLAVVTTNHRNDFRDFLKKRGIATDVHYPILDCDQLGWAARPRRISPTGLRNSQEAVERIVSLPCYPTLTDEEVRHVCAALRDW